MSGFGPSRGIAFVVDANEGTAGEKAASTPHAIVITLIPDLITLIIGTVLDARKLLWQSATPLIDGRFNSGNSARLHRAGQDGSFRGIGSEPRKSDRAGPGDGHLAIGNDRQ